MRKPTLVAALSLLTMTALQAADSHLVIQKDRKFTPGIVTIRTGDTIRFKNEDQVTHNIFSASPGQEFDLKIQRPGQTYVRTFTAPGKAEIRCAIHPQMVIDVTIKE